MPKRKPWTVAEMKTLARNHGFRLEFRPAGRLEATGLTEPLVGLWIQFDWIDPETRRLAFEHMRLVLVSFPVVTTAA